MQVLIHKRASRKAEIHPQPFNPAPRQNCTRGSDRLLCRHSGESRNPVPFLQCIDLQDAGSRISLRDCVCRIANANAPAPSPGQAAAAR